MLVCVLLVGRENGKSIMENGIEILKKKMKIGLPYDLAITLLILYPKELKAQSQRDRFVPPRA